MIGQEGSPGLGRRLARSAEIFGHGRLCYFDSQLAAVPRECGVLPTMDSLGSCPESSDEFPRPRSVFPDAAVIFASSTKRKLCGAKRSLYRGERCADYGANRATIAITRPTRAGRSAGGASEAARSFGKLRVGDEARGSPPAGRLRVRKLEATRAKRATKRELIVIAPGSHECSKPLHFQIGRSFR